MNTAKLFLTALLLVLGLDLAACASAAPPPAIPVAPRARLVRPGQFRLGVLDFGTSNTNVGPSVFKLVDPAKAIPALLAAELKKGKRFSVHEGGGIRVGGGAMAETVALDYVDAYVNGTLVSDAPAETCFELRVHNAVNHEVLFARNACVGAQRSDTTYVPDRAAVTRLADEVSRAIKEVGNAKVTAVEGKLVYIDKGADSDLMRGMVATVTATGDATQNEKTHEAIMRLTGVNPATLRSAREPVIVGMIYLFNVQRDYSVGVLYAGDYAIPGDTVDFR